MSEKNRSRCFICGKVRSKNSVAVTNLTHPTRGKVSVCKKHEGVMREHIRENVSRDEEAKATKKILEYLKKNPGQDAEEVADDLDLDLWMTVELTDRLVDAGTLGYGK